MDETVARRIVNAALAGERDLIRFTELMSTTVEYKQIDPGVPRSRETGAGYVVCRNGWIL
ncbi:MAG: hypothetical protein JO328_19910 [Hyphomicrobiales bacterium]|nr:hypothetical protein [Hyphomicrobiales bacterium]MBV9428793.1 hypothetical protein [Bradyrhizobiaceae bacterium]